MPLICQAVCWRNSFTRNDWPGQCFGFPVVNTTSKDAADGVRQVPFSGGRTGSFRVNYDDPLCDSAIWTNQPA